MRAQAQILVIFALFCGSLAQTARYRTNWRSVPLNAYGQPQLNRQQPLPAEQNNYGYEDNYNYGYQQQPIRPSAPQPQQRQFPNTGYGYGYNYQPQVPKLIVPPTTTLPPTTTTTTTPTTTTTTTPTTTTTTTTLPPTTTTTTTTTPTTTTTTQAPRQQMQYNYGGYGGYQRPQQPRKQFRQPPPTTTTTTTTTTTPPPPPIVQPMGGYGGMNDEADIISEEQPFEEQPFEEEGALFSNEQQPIQEQEQFVKPPKAIPPMNFVNQEVSFPVLPPRAVLTPCASNPCLNDGTCVELGSTFECKCPWGWIGVNCEICLTDCASNPCPANKRCKATFGGGFECVCPADRVGANCEILNDLCSTNPCLNGGICKPVEGGSFTCVCNKPWAGERCEKIWENPCNEETLRSSDVIQFKDPWDRNSYIICTDLNIFHSMPCSIGTFFNDKMRHCVPEGYDAPSCPSGYCMNDGECFITEDEKLKCMCKKGFTGLRCEENVDECALGGHSACAGGICVDQINGFYCSCANGIGINCQQTIANPCTITNLNKDLQFFEVPSVDTNVFLQCTGENTFVVSRCADNLFWHTEERTCTIERPAVKTGACLSFPCKNGGECQDLGSGRFTCVCKPGHSGEFCENIIDFCLSNPCLNGGRCLSFVGGYTCVCPDKIIDECCCNGVINPCPPKSKLIPGVNNYFPHLFPNRYLHCDFDGRAFARTCAQGTKWNQDVLTCLSDDFKFDVEPSTLKPANLPKLVPPPAVQTQPQPIRPVVQRPQQQQPIVSTGYGYGYQQQPKPQPVMSGYGSMNSQIEIVSEEPEQQQQPIRPSAPQPQQRQFPNTGYGYGYNYQPQVPKLIVPPTTTLPPTTTTTTTPTTTTTTTPTTTTTTTTLPPTTTTTTTTTPTTTTTTQAPRQQMQYNYGGYGGYQRPQQPRKQFRQPPPTTTTTTTTTTTPPPPPIVQPMGGYGGMNDEADIISEEQPFEEQPFEEEGALFSNEQQQPQVQQFVEPKFQQRFEQTFQQPRMGSQFQQRFEPAQFQPRFGEQIPTRFAPQLSQPQFGFQNNRINSWEQQQHQQQQ